MCDNIITLMLVLYRIYTLPPLATVTSPSIDGLDGCFCSRSFDVDDTSNLCNASAVVSADFQCRPVSSHLRFFRCSLPTMYVLQVKSDQESPLFAQRCAHFYSFSRRYSIPLRLLVQASEAQVRPETTMRELRKARHGLEVSIYCCCCRESVSLMHVSDLYLLYPCPLRRDIHSLHNRTTQLEAFMTMYTNGRFQSSYPSTNTSSVGVTQAVINAASFSTSQSHDLGPYHQHHHHSAASLIPNDSISTSFHSLASALSEDLELAISATSPRGQGNSLKLEPPNEVNLGALAADPVPRQSSWNRSPLSPRAAHTQPSTEQSIQGGMMLPSMGIYFGPSSPNPSNTFLHPSSSPQQPNIPRVSPNLLACLPSLPTCQRLLHIAGDVFRVRPLQFGPKYGSGNGWKGFEKKCLQLLDDSGKQNDGKGMSAKRAREIYMAGQPQHHLNRMDVEIGGTPDRVRSPGGDTALPSLTFFAMMCATLAIGAASSPNDDDESTTSESPPFFYFIAQQALGVWDTNKFSSTSWVANDCEEMEYIFACLLCIMYLLRSGALTTVVANSRREGQDYEALEDERAKILSSLVCCSPYPSFIEIYVKETFFLLSLGWEDGKYRSSYAPG